MSENKSGGSERTRQCELCLRDFPRTAIGPLKIEERTYFVCCECHNDHRSLHTESDQ